MPKSSRTFSDVLEDSVFPVRRKSKIRFHKSARSKPVRAHRTKKLASVSRQLFLEEDNDTYTEFDQAVRRGDFQQVILSLNSVTELDKPEIINRLPDDGLAALHFAVRCGDRRLVQLLLKHGANVSLVGESEMQPIHFSTKFCDAVEKFEDNSNGRKDSVNVNQSCLEMLLEHGADPNARDMFQSTPLHYACARGHVAAVKILTGLTTVKLSVANEYRSTVLHQASKYGHVETVDVLLSCKEVREKLIGFSDTFGSTPLILACRYGHTEIVKLLLEAAGTIVKNGASMRLLDKDYHQKTSLHCAVESGNCDTVELLLQFWEDENDKFEIEASTDEENKSYVDFQTSDGSTALHIAASMGSLPILQAICRRNPQLNVMATNNITPAYLAAQHSHLRCLEHLLTQGSDCELADDQLNTPLLIACINKHTEAVKMLIEHDANVFATDLFCRNSLFLAAQSDCIELVEVLLTVPESQKLLLRADRLDNTALHETASSGNLEIMKLLQSQGLSINSRNAKEETPLHVAARYGHCEIVKHIISENASAVNQVDDHGQTPLHVAARESQLQTLKELISQGASTVDIDIYGYTPLHRSVEKSELECIGILLESDPTVINTKTRSQETALHLACCHGRADAVKLLLAKGVDVTAQLRDGRNALVLAIDLDHESCVLAILESEVWADALRNAFILRGVHTTPFCQLIRFMPRAAEVVLNKCLICTEEKKNQSNSEIFEVKFNYEFLEDAYDILKWMDRYDVKKKSRLNFFKKFKKKQSTEDLEMGALSGSASSSKESEGKDENDTQSEEQVHIDNTKDISQNEVYSKQAMVLSQNHPLFIMTKHNHETLLRHPVVKSFLIYKWRRFGGIIYLINILVYLLYASLLTYNLLSTPPGYTVDFNRTIVNQTTGEVCVRVVPDAIATWGPRCAVDNSGGRLSTSYLIIIYSVLQLIKKGFHFYNWRLWFLSDFLNYSEVVVYVSSILVFVSWDSFASAAGIRSRWQVELGAYLILLSWVNVIFYLRQTRFGIYVFMVSSVVKSFLELTPVIFVFVVGYAASFFLLLQNKAGFVTPVISFVRTVAMMIGEFEFVSTFIDDRRAGYEDRVFHVGTSVFMFFTFMILVSLLLSNLMVGIAVDDIALVYDNAELRQLAVQVETLLRNENTLPERFRRSLICTGKTVRINKHGTSNTFRKLVLNILAYDTDLIEAQRKRLNEEITSDDDLQEKPALNDVKDMKQTLKELSSAIVDMKSKEEKSNQQMDLIAQSLQELLQKA